MTRLAALALGLAVAACLACRQSDPPPPPPPRPALPATEVKRAKDACKAYVDKACACARSIPALDQTCKLARALPDAIQVSLDLGASTDASGSDLVQAQDAVRKIAKECIEELARLPAAGCP